jgi:3'-5' exonuclease
LTFYNVSGREGAARRFNLDFYCKAFGIESPKAQGVTGSDMNTMVAEKRFREIAEYCLRDVKATVLLYHIWKERLAGVK